MLYIEDIGGLSLIKLQRKLATQQDVDFSNARSLTLPSNAGLIATTAPVIAGGLTASGSASNDFSGSTGTFKFPTGATSGYKRLIVDMTSSTATPTAGQSGSIFLFDRAAGVTVTLPTPAVGLYYDFFVVTTVTSNSYKVITDAGTTLLAGSIAANIDNTANKQWVGNGTTHIAVTQAAASTNATGGIIGSWVRFTCVTSTLWAVEGMTVAGGTPTTPFATS